MFKISLFILFLITPLFAGAEFKPLSKEAFNQYEEAIKSLASVKSLKCYFPKGTLVSWKSNKIKLVNDPMGNPIHFDNIDAIKKRRARIIGNLGSADVFAYISPTGITFIEETKVGNKIFTSVFPSYLGDKKINGEPQNDSYLYQKAFIAVTSRHIYIPSATAMPSQFYGFCRIFD